MPTPDRDPEYDSAIAHLKRLRERYRQRNLPLYDPSGASSLEVLRECYGPRLDQIIGTDRLNAAVEAFSRPPASKSVLQDDPWAHVLGNIVAEIDGLVQPDVRTERAKILFASVPTGDVNGMAIALPITLYRFVLIDDGLFGFANLATKVMARAFPLRSEKVDGMDSFSTSIVDIKEEVARNPTIAERMLDFLMAYVVHGHPHRATPYLLDTEYLGLSSSLRIGLETFVVGHEYGHCIAGHLDKPRSFRRVLSDGNGGLDAIATNWTQEHEADAVGCMLAVTAMRRQGYDLPLAYWGVEAFFGCVDLIERSVSLLLNGKVAASTPSDTHPSVPARVACVRAFLQEWAKSDRHSDALAMADCLAAVVEHCWTACVPQLQKLHDEGIRPAHQWVSD